MSGLLIVLELLAAAGLLNAIRLAVFDDDMATMVAREERAFALRMLADLKDSDIRREYALRKLSLGGNPTQGGDRG